MKQSAQKTRRKSGSSLRGVTGAGLSRYTPPTSGRGEERITRKKQVRTQHRRRRTFGPIRRNHKTVPHFCQSIGPWAETLMNHDDSIASAGCAVCSGAQLLAYYGRPVTPLVVDQHLDRNGGYVTGDDAIRDWNVLYATQEEETPNLKITWAESIRLYDGGDKDRMNQLIHENLSQNIPVIVRIRYADSNANMNHFATCYGLTKQGKHMLRDPGSSSKKTILEDATRRGGMILVGADFINVETI